MIANHWIYTDRWFANEMKNFIKRHTFLFQRSEFVGVSRHKQFSLRKIEPYMHHLPIAPFYIYVFIYFLSFPVSLKFFCFKFLNNRVTRGKHTYSVCHRCRYDSTAFVFFFEKKVVRSLDKHWNSYTNLIFKVLCG